MFNNDNTLHKVQHQHHHPGGISRVVDRFMTVMACERYGTRYPKLDIWGKKTESVIMVISKSRTVSGFKPELSLTVIDLSLCHQ